MKPPLSGQFLYQSFYNGPVEVRDGKVEGLPVLAEPWKPTGTLDVETDPAQGNVFGRLVLHSDVVLNVTGKFTPASSSMAASIDLRGEGSGAVYQLRGWFVPAAGHVVGTVLCLAGDLMRHPVGTIGAFVLCSKSS